MYICDECGKVVETLPVSRDSVPYGEGCAYYEYAESECSCGGEYVEATKCLCGKWISEEEKYHKECIKPYRTLDNALEIGSWQMEKLEINDFIISVFGKENINKILIEVFKAMDKPTQQKHIEDYLDEYDVELKDIIERILKNEK